MERKYRDFYDFADNQLKGYRNPLMRWLNTLVGRIGRSVAFGYDIPLALGVWGGPHFRRLDARNKGYRDNELPLIVKAYRERTGQKDLGEFEGYLRNMEYNKAMSYMMERIAGGGLSDGQVLVEYAEFKEFYDLFVKFEKFDKVKDILNRNYKAWSARYHRRQDRREARAQRREARRDVKVQRFEDKRMDLIHKYGRTGTEGAGREPVCDRGRQREVYKALSQASGKTVKKGRMIK